MKSTAILWIGLCLSSVALAKNYDFGPSEGKKDVSDAKVKELRERLEACYSGHPRDIDKCPADHLYARFVKACGFVAPTEFSDIYLADLEVSNMTGLGLIENASNHYGPFAQKCEADPTFGPKLKKKLKRFTKTWDEVALKKVNPSQDAGRPLVLKLETDGTLRITVGSGYTPWDQLMDFIKTI